MSKKLPSRSSFAAAFEPRNPEQALVQRLWPTKDVFVLLGPAGTGKTLVAVALAALDVLHKRAEKLVVLRPAVEADRSIGFLPGTLREKLEPYAAPAIQALKKVTCNYPEDALELDAVGYARGLTYTNSVVIVDEAQNVTYKQAKLILTRLGVGSKIVFCGDPEQSDIRGTDPDYDTDIEAIADDLCGLTNVSIVDFSSDSIVRHPRLKSILSRLR